MFALSCYKYRIEFALQHHLTCELEFHTFGKLSIVFFRKPWAGALAIWNSREWRRRREKVLPISEWGFETFSAGKKVIVSEAYTVHILIKKLPNIAQSLNFLTLDVRWGSKFLPTERSKIRNFRKSFTLLAKLWKIDIQMFPKSFTLLRNHNTGSSDVKNDHPGIQGDPTRLKKWQFQTLNFFRSFTAHALNGA